MNDKFTIKFKGTLDHAATRKSLEKDISKLEHLITPKRITLGSSKEFIKYNLNEKKLSLQKQNKYEHLRERIEKFRLSETKKLIKKGHTFHKARYEAFKRSLMSSKDLRALEYKHLQEDTKQKNKLIKQARKSITVPIAIGSAIGNVASNAMSNFARYAINALKEKSNQARMSLISSKFFNSDEKTTILGKLKGIKSFHSGIEREDFLNKAGVIKSTLKNMGIHNKDTLLKAVEFAAKIKGSGILSTDQAISSIADLLSGKGDSTFALMSQFDDFGSKYLEYSKDRYESNVIYDPNIASEMLEHMLRDFTSLGLTKNLGLVENTHSDIKKLDDELKNITSDILTPISKYLLQIITWTRNFDLEKDIINPLIQNIKSIFSLEYFFAKLKSILPSFLGGDGGSSLGAYYKHTTHTGGDDSTRIP
ncbi:DUF759 family protein [Borrelia miyamotoi]|uniref:DUF759 family protein n=1 Tax=Borrelia miyamotoi TaxID=47466 RepID=A0AAQ2WWS0_9SPIR|nr:DUF759 family protein [Borrelia miyamotoi]AOW96156.1 hypothetical protein AXH25_05620 [Borrelia miyamotoi]WAZ91684.1 DUF759 family protein [Borrelia miyamotoi]WAZ95535.1 DUF759 family protein [Borrelia miyamotoi]WAZ98155.1 DUF759 family protein [Borrelia miyamotoi]